MSLAHRSLLLLALIAMFLSSVGAADDSDLLLHLEASRGVSLDGGNVTAWADGERWGAIVPEGYDRPRFIRETKELGGKPCVAFAGRDLLGITGQVLPKDAVEMTVVAVARMEAASSVGIFSIREATNRTIQLDTDAHGNARFIVRDKSGRAANSVEASHHGTWGVWIGVLRSGADGESTTQVFFNKACGPEANSDLSLPLAGTSNWIGGLPLGRHFLSWNGAIAEISVYDRALANQEREELALTLCEKYGIDYQDTGRVAPSAIYPWKTEPKPADEEMSTDVCIVGAGSGGIGAALAAARSGADVILVERQEKIGGTGVNALVSGWEPGPGCSIAREIYDEMRKVPRSTGVSRLWPRKSTGFSMGLWLIDESLADQYILTTRRAGVSSNVFHNVPYRPEAMDRACRDLLKETARVTLLDRTTFFYATANDAKSRVESILVEDAQGAVTKISAEVFIDSTGCVHLCRAVGCETMLGFDPISRFDEPSAPEKGSLQLNAISRCYTVKPSKNPTPQPPIEPVPYFAKVAHVTGWVDGHRVINPLPSLPGRALIDFGYEKCLERSERSALAHWHWLQQQADFEGYELDYIAPMLGIRESYRVVTDYILNEHDLIACLPGQKHDDIIAVADHPCDIHGAGGGLGHVENAYGVPYRCLIPKGDWENLLVACRGSGMSKIAASSCRLQRTIIQLGHAAGMAAAMAVEADVPVDEIDVGRLVETLDAPSRYRWLEENMQER
ncbi:MAG: FAD-dependent oxidoreductase [Planctomycetes bacterium]|nr:FAD-dependent oxidoreductase [Planctomycetota bacterium]MBL7038420.1 FAD-dependent oxidoreductase [Pirellulaceae bacterium]